MEAVTRALRGIALEDNSQTTHAIILAGSLTLLQKVKNGKANPDWHVSAFDIHLRKLLWVYCPGHARVKGNDRADRLAGKATTAQTDLRAKQPSQVICDSAGSSDDGDVERNVFGCRVGILGTNCDQCVCMVQCCFTSTETIRLIRTATLTFTQLLYSGSAEVLSSLRH